MKQLCSLLLCFKWVWKSGRLSYKEKYERLWWRFGGRATNSKCDLSVMEWGYGNADLKCLPSEKVYCYCIEKKIWTKCIRSLKTLEKQPDASASLIWTTIVELLRAGLYITSGNLTLCQLSANIENSVSASNICYTVRRMRLLHAGWRPLRRTVDVKYRS